MPEDNIIDIGKLTADPDNVRKHPNKNLSAITGSLKQFGAARSIVIDGKDVVRAGNGTLQQAVQAGIKKVQIVDADGQTLIAVRRKDWSDSQAAGYAVTDNRTNDLATWNFGELSSQLQALAGHDIPMADLGWNEKDLDIMASHADLPGVKFPEYTEDDADNVEMITCPHCQNQFPK